MHSGHLGLPADHCGLFLQRIVAVIRCLTYDCLSPSSRSFFLSHTCSVTTLLASPPSYFLTQTSPCWLYAYLLRWSLPYLLDLSPALLSREVSDLLSTLYSIPIPKLYSQQVLHPCSSNEVERRGCFCAGHDGGQGGLPAQKEAGSERVTEGHMKSEESG